MKVLIYNPLTAVWRPRLPAMLSVLQESIDAGDEVVYIACDRNVPACTATLDHSRAVCSYCMARNDRGLSLVDGAFSRRSLSDYLSEDRYQELWHSADDFADPDQLRLLHYHGADIGYAALSSFAYVARNSRPDLDSPAVRGVIQKLLNTGKIVYEALTEAIQRECPDRVILFHGRSAIDRAALRACDHLGTECHVYETALAVNKLLYFKNALPQDIDYFVKMVEALWDDAPEDRVEIGKLFFEMRRQGATGAGTGKAMIATQDRVYVGDQQDGLIPSGWDDSFRNVVIFGSSDDEFVAISPDYESSIYSSQLDATGKICAALADDKNIRVYYRAHPREKGGKNDALNELLALAERCDNLVVIPANSSVSSYALLDRADTVLAFRSTMAVEAVYWGKPCILLSCSIFKPLGATYNPLDHEEVIEMIRAGLSPMDRTPVLKLGYFRIRGGFSSPYFEGDMRKGAKGYSFKGQSTGVSGLKHWLYFIARERQRVKWRRMV